MLKLEDVYREHFRFVWRNLLRLGVPDADAPDAAQEVFLVVHARLASFEGRSKVTTWLFGICLRVAQARGRRASERQEFDADDLLSAVADEAEDAGRQLERGQDAALVEAVLAEMDVKQRTVFMLFELEEMTCKEIALAVEAPVGTVFSRLRLARASFAEIFARHQARARFRPARPGRQEGSP